MLALEDCPKGSVLCGLSVMTDNPQVASDASFSGNCWWLPMGQC